MFAIVKLAGVIGAVALGAAYLLSAQLDPAKAPQSASAVSAAPVQAQGPASHAMSADRSGHYAGTMLVNGISIPMLVDTGATVVALRYEDAAQLGIRPANADYRRPVSTANGVTKAAEVTVNELRVGSVSMRNVAAIVMPPGVLQQNLLGMSFLGRLSSFQVTSGQLVMKQ